MKREENFLPKVKGEESYTYAFALEMYEKMPYEEQKKLLDAIVGKQETKEELIDAIVKSGAGSSYAYEIRKKLSKETQKKMDEIIEDTKKL